MALPKLDPNKYAELRGIVRMALHAGEESTIRSILAQEVTKNNQRKSVAVQSVAEFLCRKIGYFARLSCKSRQAISLTTIDNWDEFIAVVEKAKESIDAGSKAK